MKKSFAKDNKEKWIADRIIVLSKEELLSLENIQLKLEIVKKTELELANRKKDLLSKQIIIAENIGKKYEIDIEGYDIDLIQGICLRKDNVKNCSK